MEELYFVTGNKEKCKEVNKILKGKIKFANLNLNEIQSGEIYEIVKHKAKEAYKILGEKVVVEDISLYLECLNRFPGPFVKFMIASIGSEGIYKMVKNYREKTAVVRCVVCHFDGKEFKFFTGDVKGKIVSPKGKNGWGFDPIFMPDGKKKTFSQMKKSEKNEISHRAIALRKFKTFLEK
ncbi:MAG: RdgB/HAM1 family non-canonical purine NTP pyrophosphatase [Nanoarchaeota archaeon]|nr:RdgB/HAM1 family non-canonical purine NTP pyrophosphatase [Nanoarchaeota archaeon]